MGKSSKRVGSSKVEPGTNEVAAACSLVHISLPCEGYCF